MKVQPFLVTVLKETKHTKVAFKQTIYLKLKIASVMWPPPTHPIKNSKNRIFCIFLSLDFLSTMSNCVDAIKCMLFYYCHISNFVFFHTFVCSFLLPCMLKSTVLCVGVKTLYNTNCWDLYNKTSSVSFIFILFHPPIHGGQKYWYDIMFGSEKNKIHKNGGSCLKTFVKSWSR